MEWTPKTLLMECDSADKLRDDVCATLDIRIARYVGPEYGYGDGEYWPENYYFAWVSYVLPQIVAQNPRVKITSLRTEEFADESKALEVGLNRWIRDTNHRLVLKRLGLDMGFGYGVSLTRPVPVPGGESDDPPWRPQVSRINPRLFSMDPLAESLEDARYAQHVTIRDKDELIQWAKDHPDEGWNIKAIEATGCIQAYDITKSKAKGVPDRGQIAYREIWCAEVNDYIGKGDDPEDYNGSVYTMALHPSSQRDLEWLREPRPHMGPRWGPYTMFGAHIVPGCPYPLGPLVANGGLFEEVNALELANYQAARNYKQIGLYDKIYEKDAAAIAKARAWEAVGITGLTKDKFIVAELGGVSQTGIVQGEHARQAASRGIGINEIQQGSIQAAGDPLATEVLQAQGATNVRTGDLASEFYHADSRQLSTVAFYMLKFDKVAVPLTDEDKAQLGIPPDAKNARWVAKGSKLRPDSMEIEIEPYSMRRPDEPQMQARAMAGANFAIQTAPLIPQTPWIRWKAIYKSMGDSWNWPGYEDILDEEVAAEATAMIAQQMQAQTEGGESAPQGATPEPRLLGDLAKPPAQGFPKAGRSKPPVMPKPPNNGAAKPAKVGAGSY